MAGFHNWLITAKQLVLIEMVKGEVMIRWEDKRLLIKLSIEKVPHNSAAYAW